RWCHAQPSESRRPAERAASASRPGVRAVRLRHRSAARARSVSNVRWQVVAHAGGSGKLARMAKVLIVEDDEVIAQGMATHLTGEGFAPIVAAKGDQGLARLRYEQPDVVVLDLMLPERDGWSVIETARQEGIGTPIVVVSARGTEHDRVHALEIGADDY